METVFALFKAFVVGGLICVVGQILIDRTNLTPARILTGYVVAGVVLYAIGLYEPLRRFAGAGASVPLTGFGALLAKGSAEAVAEEGGFGALVGGSRIAAAGIAAAIFFALLFGLLCRPKRK